MQSKPTRTFSSAYAMTVDAAALQLSRHEAIRIRMTTGALSLVAALAMSLTAPAPAQAQNNIQRAAADVLGGVIGGAIGDQVGGGSGRKYARVAGAAAGVWAAETMQGNNAGSRSSGSRGTLDPSVDNFGPSGWTANQQTGRSQRTQSPAYSGNTSSTPQLQSGFVQLSPERSARLWEMERAFLTARDNYARALHSSQQMLDDMFLFSKNKSLDQKVSEDENQKRAAESNYAAARKPFVEALEHLGARGYDVHKFAYSYQLSRQRVTAGDMSRGDLGQAVHFRASLHEPEQPRGDSYNMR